MSAKLNNNTYTRIIQYLQKYTKEDYETLIIYSDNELYSKYKRVSYGIEKFPYELDAYFKSHPGINPKYSLDELLRMKIEDLEELRNRFGLGKRKKVTQTVHDGQLTFDAITALDKQTTKETITNIITNNQEPDNERELQILTPKELAMMYGEEELSPEELAARGYISDEIREQKDNEESIRYDKIIEIYETGLFIGGTQVELEELLNIGKEELEFLYSLTKKHLDKTSEQERLKSV